MVPVWTTSPPNASIIAWWPKQMPIIGTSCLSCLIISIKFPASAGVPGPGDSATIHSGVLRAFSKKASNG